MKEHTNTLSHINQHGEANMVDVTDKDITQRVAYAVGKVIMSPATFGLISTGQHAKGDVLAVARIAGIQAAKKCGELIPLCHPLMLTKVQVDFESIVAENAMQVTAMCKLAGKTGVEMEALTAVSVACLTLFDMCKAVDPEMVISDVKVLSKRGGKTGDWSRGRSLDESTAVDGVASDDLRRESLSGDDLPMENQNA